MELICIGDSITSGDSYVERIDKPGYIISKKGIKGSHMKRYARTIIQDTANADIVLLQDSGILRDSFQEDLDDAISKIPDKVLILTTIPKLEDKNASRKWQKRYSNQNIFIREYALTHNLIVVDWEECFDRHKDLNLTIDGIHPTEAGKQILADCVEEKL